MVFVVVGIYRFTCDTADEKPPTSTFNCFEFWCHREALMLCSSSGSSISLSISCICECCLVFYRIRAGAVAAVSISDHWKLLPNNLIRIRLLWFHFGFRALYFIPGFFAHRNTGLRCKMNEEVMRLIWLFSMFPYTSRIFSFRQIKRTRCFFCLLLTSFGAKGERDFCFDSS